MTQAAKPLPKGMKKVRVLPLGDGKISTGEIETASDGIVFLKAKKNDHLIVAESVAKEQEENGLVEIV